MAEGESNAPPLTPEILRELLENTPPGLSDLKPLIIHMSGNWEGYLNDVMLEALQSGSPGSLTHVHMLPWGGDAVVVPARAGEPGARRLYYTRTRTGATVSFYRVMRRLNEARPPQGRLRVLPVRIVPVGEATVLVVAVKGTTTIPSRQQQEAEEQVAAAKQDGEAPPSPVGDG